MRPFRSEHIPRPAVPAPLAEWVATAPEFDLEIGAGAGLHAIRRAVNRPERTLVAVERTEIKYAGLARRHRQHGAPDNLKILRGDAVAFVTHFVRDEQLATVFLLYPNPYPKERQANLRWYASPFLAHLRQKMAPGAELHLATNLDWYADGARRELPKTFGFALARERTLGPHDVARTHFEKKYLARGEPCFDLVFRRE